MLDPEQNGCEDGDEECRFISAPQPTKEEWERLYPSEHTWKSLMDLIHTTVDQYGDEELIEENELVAEFLSILGLYPSDVLRDKDEDEDEDEDEE